MYAKVIVLLKTPFPLSLAQWVQKEGSGGVSPRKDQRFMDLFTICQRHFKKCHSDLRPFDKNNSYFYE